MPPSTPFAPTSSKIEDIELNDIFVSEQNVRHHDPEVDLDDLAASIKAHGLLQPVVLMKTKDKKPHNELISGQRRFLAHLRLGETTIRAVFVEPLNETDTIVRSLVENMQRLDLEYRDTAEAVTYLYNKYGRNDRKVHKETGLSLRKVREYIEIESRATPKMKSLLRGNKIKPVDVKRAINAAQDDMKKADRLVDLMTKETLTSYQKRRLVEYGERDKTASAESILERAKKPHIEETVVISLTPELRAGLETATRMLEMEVEELTTQALSEWLRTKGFLKV